MVKSIKLSQVAHTRAGFSKFGQDLLSGLGEDLFEIYDKQELLFRILNQVSPINKSLKKEDLSIEKACEKIIKALGLDKVAHIISLNPSRKQKEIKEESYTHRFCNYIIEIENPPAPIYKELLLLVNKDLYEISDLIKWYEKQPVIAAYLKKGDLPKSHEDKVVYDYYKRCISERIIILDYQLYGVKKRAIQKAKKLPVWLFRYRDRPYSFGDLFSEPHFDYLRIDRSVHRVDNLEFDYSEDMQTLYEADRSKFYRIYFKRTPAQKHFDEFKFYLDKLPLANSRDLIFDELIKLFKGQRWISFYALALPQVEGLFSEMCNAIDPEKQHGQKSLPQKVDLVRPYHNMSKYYFDYYQYFIPIQRNRFAHTGYDEDFKIKSFDLLLDLSHLLKIFYELKNPLVAINKLHKQRNYEDFVTVKEFSNYFNLINGLKDKQRDNIQTQIVNFEKDFLVKDCGLDYICYQLFEDLPKQLKDFIDNIESNFKARDKEIEFLKLKRNGIDALLKDEKRFKFMDNCFIYKYDLYETLEIYSVFINCFTKQLPSLNDDLKKQLTKLKNEFGAALNDIVYIKNLLKRKKKQIFLDSI
jgi:hypothetical protein